jgi:hypothetical protein
MVAGDPRAPAMQCHCTPDDDPKVCVGFAIQVGPASVAYRLAVVLGYIDPLALDPDGELHSAREVIETHGGVPA